MKMLIGLFMFTMILSAGMVSLSYAAGDIGAPGTQTVKGDVLKIDGEFYVVKDMTGNEVRLHVDKTTKLEGSVKAGDKVEAKVTEKGHALSITKPLVADAHIPGPHTVKGDLLKIDGEFYVVKDITGKEVRLHVDKDTTMDGSINVGEGVEVQATEKNHALSIRHLQPVQSKKK
jgi:translation elongation factor P/translation initiation factor 5A